jgi:hypothetical protein
MVNHDRRSKLLYSYENAAVIVSGIDAADLGQPTPCRKYDVAGLVDHIVEAGHRAAALGRGQAPPPGDDSPHVELADAPGQLRRAAEDAAQAWDDDVCARQVPANGGCCSRGREGFGQYAGRLSEVLHRSSNL